MRRTIVCFAGDVWDGNPHSRHHLMRRFAQSNWNVLWVEGVPMRSVAAPGRTELRRIAAKLRARSGLRTVLPGLHVLRPLPVPPAGRIGRALQLLILRRQVVRALRELGLDPPALTWFSVPVTAPLRGRLGEQASILYYQDRYDEFSHVDRGFLRYCLRSLAVGCDISVASAEELAADLRLLGASPVVVPHGVDVDHFARAVALPAELEGLERPIIGYVGLIDDHLDMNAIRSVAESLERGVVVLVGGRNTDASPLDHSRIVMIDRRPYPQMPAFIQGFDACLVPFSRNRLTEGVNPIKLREYLAAGRPVVATALPEIVPYGDVVRLVRSDEDWPTAVAQAIASDDREARVLRRQRVAPESWDAAFASIESLVIPLVEPAPQSP